MRRLLRSGILGLVLWAAFPADALAVLGWLEKLSGPGDFVGPEFLVPFACYGERVFMDARQSGSASTPDAAAASRTLFPDWDCRRAKQDRFRAIFAVDLAALSTADSPIDYGDDPKPSVRLVWVMPTVMVPLHPTVRVGAGFGFGRFSGSNDVFDPFWRLMFQPVRVSVTPLRVFGRDRRLEILQVHIGLMMVVGDISASDFGGVGSLRESNEVVPHVEIAIDVARLF
jgi:hypothetical protein